jgi:hypothetical protein
VSSRKILQQQNLCGIQLSKKQAGFLRLCMGDEKCLLTFFFSGLALAKHF